MNGPLKRRWSLEVAATAVPMLVAVGMLAMFIVPNYLQATRWSEQARTLRASAQESAARMDTIRSLQSRNERLRLEQAERGHSFPASLGEGQVLRTMASAADDKGIQGSETRVSTLVSVAVPLVAGGKATRRSVEVDMRGGFEAIFKAVRRLEELRTAAVCRSVELTGDPAGIGTTGPIHGHLVIHEYFGEQAHDGTAAPAGKDGE
jgi:type II secretory pathway pseudopilin PulG